MNERESFAVAVSFGRALSDFSLEIGTKMKICLSLYFVGIVLSLRLT